MSAWQDLPIEPGRPLALLADVHANLEALHAVVEDLDRQGVDQAVVLGDLVGYGASPNEVVAVVEQKGWPMIRGNHEDMLRSFATVDARGVLKKRARKAIEWTRDQLESGVSSRLASLPLGARLAPDLWAVHGSLVDPVHCYAYIYDLSMDLNVRALRRLGAPAGTVVLHGHTHWPRLFRISGDTWHEQRASADGELGERRLGFDGEWMLNPGSVGYPRDGDARAGFAIWWHAERRLEHRRLAYDVEAAAEKVRRAGYAPEMAERLIEAR